MNENKVLVIGIDGGTWNIINPLVKMGKLPNISALMKKGCYSNLKSTIPPVTGAAWTSFMTGNEPINTGHFEFYFLENHEVKTINSQTKKGLAIWEILSINNLKSIVINVPLTNPPYKINGYMISGIPVRDPYNITYPNNLFERLNISNINYHIQPPNHFMHMEMIILN